MMNRPYRAFVFAIAPVLVLMAFLVGAPAHATEVKEVKSAKGIVAWLVEDHTNPVISVNFSFKGGAALDPLGKEGLANLVSGLIDEGAGSLDSTQFQQRLADNSITLRFDAGKDNFSGTFKTLSENLDLASELLKLAVTEPRFDAEPVERIRAQIVANIRHKAEDIGDIASNALFSNFFPDHGYGKRTEGSVESVASIGRDDLVWFVGERFALENLVVGVSGDITVPRLKEFLDATFGALPASTSANAPSEVVPNATGRLEVIERDVPQSMVMFGHQGIKRDDPDFYAALVMNHVLGGGSFTSRLYNEVREKRGLAYSVGTGLYAFDRAGAIVGSAGTANAEVAKTIDVIRDQWALMAEGVVTDTELADAKTYITGAFPLRFTSSAAISRILVSMQLNDLGVDYLDHRASYIKAVSAADISRVAKRLLHPALLDIVVVGKPQGL